MLVWQIQVFQFLLGSGRHQGGQQFGRHFPLILDALDHGFTAVFQLTQVAKARLQLAQLNVVQAVGDFLTVTRDEWNGGSTVQQLNGCLDLLLGNLDLCGNLPDDFLHEN